MSARRPAGRRRAADRPASSRRLIELAGHDDAIRAAFWLEVARRFELDHAAIVTSGPVEINADAGYGAIRPGDLLTASPTPGHAMLATEARPGTIVAKAIGGLESGMGKLRVVVMLR